MIIQCEKCQTKFNLKESLLKKEGSKVRCSNCKHIFVAYPPKQVSDDEVETVAVSRTDLEKKAAGVADVPPPVKPRKDQEIDFDSLFDESLADLDKIDDIFGEDDSLDAEEVTEQKEPLEEILTEQEPARPLPEKKTEEGQPKSEEIFSTFPGRRPAKSNLLTILLVIFLVVILAGAAIFFWLPDLIPDSLTFLKPADKKEITDMGVSRLSLANVSGTFVDSQEAGRLFVIRGSVQNNYPKSRRFILIRGSILDDKGKTVKATVAYAGNTLKDEELRVVPLAEIHNAMKNRSGKNNSNTNVAPGASIPFMIVMDNLPENLYEFEVQGVSSSPGA